MYNRTYYKVYGKWPIYHIENIDGVNYFVTSFTELGIGLTKIRLPISNEHIKLDFNGVLEYLTSAGYSQVAKNKIKLAILSTVYPEEV